MNKLEKKRIKDLYKITKCLEKLKIHYVISDEALLVFIRKKSLINYFGDIEISIRYIDYKRNLINIIKTIDNLKIGQIEINNSYENPNLIIKQIDFKFILKGFHYSKDKKNIFRKLYISPAKYLNEISIIKIMGFDFCIPKNPEELLNLQYGKDWGLLLQSKYKIEYLNLKIHKIINNKFFIYVKKLLKKRNFIFNLPKYILMRLLSNFPIFEYSINQSREQLFLEQLAYVSKNKLNPILIEIGSSDLKEALILSRINKNKNLSVKVFEASKSTYLDLIKIKKYHCLKNVDIFHKAVIPSLSNYQLKENTSPNLNEMIFINKKNKNNMNNILLSDIRELKDEGIHKLVKMDIEGLEEKLIVDNLNYLKTLKNISFTIEIHQAKYNNPLVFEKVIHDLLNNKYSLLFIELSRDCNDELKNNMKKRGLIFKKAGGRFLIKNPDSSLVKYIVNCQYSLIKNYPFFSRRNIRSITLTKSI